jgi:uncharacterized protein (DUF952 family)
MYFKILTKKERQEITDVYTGSAMDKQDGFIHLSLQHQVDQTANRFYQDYDELVLMVFQGSVTMEPGFMNGKTTTELFPHLYGTITTRDCEFRTYTKVKGVFPAL